MNIIERIRAEIERRRLHFNKEAEKYQALNNGYSQNCYGARDALRDLENFLDTLPDESEQPTMGYDEAYLNEKIAMTNEELLAKIKAEIERLIEASDFDESANLYGLLSFLDTLEEPEQPTMGYDEAYLNEKIAKASKSWEGVDVDKFMDEVRGREPVSNDLEEAARHSEMLTYPMPEDGDVEKVMKVQEARIFHEIGFKAGAEWAKRKMMEGAESAEIGYFNHRGLSILTEKSIERMPVSEGEKVRIIIVKEEEQ